METDGGGDLNEAKRCVSLWRLQRPWSLLPGFSYLLNFLAVFRTLCQPKMSVFDVFYLCGSFTSGQILPLSWTVLEYEYIKRGSIGFAQKCPSERNFTLSTFQSLIFLTLHWGKRLHQYCFSQQSNYLDFCLSKEHVLLSPLKHSKMCGVSLRWQSVTMFANGCSH